MSDLCRDRAPPDHWRKQNQQDTDAVLPKSGAFAALNMQ
jgi:hypothetical protein